MPYFPFHLRFSLGAEVVVSPRTLKTHRSVCSEAPILFDRTAHTTGVSEVKHIGDQATTRSVRFSDNDDNSVVVEVIEIECITDPDEMARIYTKRDEIERQRANTRRSTMEAFIDYFELLQEMKDIFLGPKGNASRKLDLLLDWNRFDDDHRGLESHFFRKWIAEGDGLSSDWDGAAEWSAFLALVDCISVYGTSKAYEDIARIISPGEEPVCETE